MKAHILQHVPFEGPGHIGDWLAARGADIGSTRFWESPVLPDPAAIDLLVVMGGPMSVNDEAELPCWSPRSASSRKWSRSAGRCSASASARS